MKLFCFLRGPIVSEFFEFFAFRSVVRFAGVSIVAFFLLSGCGGDSRGSADANHLFSLETIDADGPMAAWGKSVGDINGDGLPDLIVGGQGKLTPSLANRLLHKVGLAPDPWLEGGALIWYENPHWQPHLISHRYKIRTDIEVRDMDGDGLNDVVISADEGLMWLKNPTWESHLIDPIILHDVEVADLDNDGDWDIVARDQSLFRQNDGNALHIYRQDGVDQWHHLQLAIDHGEGLKVADMNRDGLADIVVNRYWLLNPGTLSEDSDWQRISYAAAWDWDDVYIDTADFNGDGSMDVVLSPSEEAGENYQVAWFEAPATADGKWHKHVVDDEVEAVLHFVAARDVDNDGDMDVLTAEMNQGRDPDQVLLYINEGDDDWQKRVLAPFSSHSMRAVDIDNDGDIDLFGADWHFPDPNARYRVSLWRNQTTNKNYWPRLVIDENRPGQATFVMTGDLDGDGLLDVITGGYWYRQPAVAGEAWQRHTLGENANNVALVRDFDGDGDLDFLASGWIGYNNIPTLLDRALNRLRIKAFDYEQPGGRFVWGENNGKGEFTIHDNIERMDGDFLQGVGWLTTDGVNTIALSWHDPQFPLDGLTVPANPVTDMWRRSQISAHSQSEQLTISDIDRDGRQDILLGTEWLKNTPEGWQLNTLFDTSSAPDRNRMSDINGDGKLDAVVGYEAISKMGKLAWYEQPADAQALWSEHIIADDVIGPMSLSVQDMDGDNDMDVVVGEHNLVQPSVARLFWFENVGREKQTKGQGQSWHRHTIYSGDEHHDGAVTVDIDGDGDLDILSIGWSHGKVVLYRNPAVNRNAVQPSDQ